jgi:hypothetical protein
LALGTTPQLLPMDTLGFKSLSLTGERLRPGR